MKRHGVDNFRDQLAQVHEDLANTHNLTFNDDILVEQGWVEATAIDNEDYFGGILVTDGFEVAFLAEDKIVQDGLLLLPAGKPVLMARLVPGADVIAAFTSCASRQGYEVSRLMGHTALVDKSDPFGVPQPVRVIMYHDLMIAESITLNTEGVDSDKGLGDDELMALTRHVESIVSSANGVNV